MTVTSTHDSAAATVSITPPRLTDGRLSLHRPVLIVGALLALVVAALLVAPPAHASKDCGTYHGRGGPYRVVVDHGPVRCRTARRILRRYATSHAPCSGSGCYRTIKGWTCGSGNAGAYPRLFSCSRERRSIAAYSLAD
jgi:hypothetical protein